MRADIISTLLSRLKARWILAEGYVIRLAFLYQWVSICLKNEGQLIVYFTKYFPYILKKGILRYMENYADANYILTNRKWLLN